MSGMMPGKATSLVSFGVSKQKIWKRQHKHCSGSLRGLQENLKIKGILFHIRYFCCLHYHFILCSFHAEVFTINFSTSLFITTVNI